MSLTRTSLQPNITSILVECVRERCSSLARSSFQSDLLRKLIFKRIEVLRVDLRIILHKLFHIIGNCPFDLQLLNVTDFTCDGELSKEVTREHFLKVTLFAEAGSGIRL